MTSKINKYALFIFLTLGISIAGYSQVGIGTITPSTASMLHIEAIGGDKGVLLPKVKLTNLSSFTPIKGDGTAIVNLGLVVFNENETNDIKSGYYYWTGKRWTRIVDAESIESIVPTVPNINSTDEGKKSYVIFNESSKEFFAVNKANDGKTTLDLVPMDEIVKRHETNTLISRRYDSKKGIGSYESSSVEPTQKAGSIIYKYSSEELDDKGNRKKFYINMTEDLYKTINESELIQDVINDAVINRLTKSGNVYFGDVGGKNVLYIIRKDELTGKEVIEVIDIKSSVLTVLRESKQEIINELMSSVGYDIAHMAVYTGNTYQGKEIYSFGGNVVIEEGNSETKGVSIPKLDIDTFDKVFSIKLYDLDEHYINVGITDIYLSNNGTRVEFSLGFGGIYTVLPAGNYSAIVEFTKK